MSKLIQAIKDDLSFIKSHTLQPQWYKILKVFILIGFLVGYHGLFGLWKTVIFFSCLLASDASGSSDLSHQDQQVSTKLA